MTMNATTAGNSESRRTPGSAEGERDRSEQNDRADENAVGQSDGNEFEADDADADELGEDEEA
jgi:hypothetical protein